MGKWELEEESAEEWSRKKSKNYGYLNPTTFEVSKPRITNTPVVTDIKRKSLEVLLESIRCDE